MSRLAYRQISPPVFEALIALDKNVRALGLPNPWVDLIYLRVSQLNHCAFCVDMHAKELAALGVAREKVDMLPVFAESPFYDEREKAALRWAESVHLLGEAHVPDAMFESVRTVLSDKELVDLTLVVGAINAWNRIGVAFRLDAGKYVAGTH